MGESLVIHNSVGGSTKDWMCKRMQANHDIITSPISWTFRTIISIFLFPKRKERCPASKGGYMLCYEMLWRSSRNVGFPVSYKTSTSFPSRGADGMLGWVNLSWIYCWWVADDILCIPGNDIMFDLLRRLCRDFWNNSEPEEVQILASCGVLINWTRCGAEKIRILLATNKPPQVYC